MLQDLIYGILGLSFADHVVVKWISGHLDSEDSAAKRRQTHENGTSIIHDIAGDVNTDSLPAQCTRAHAIIFEIITLAEDRATLHRTVLQHLVLVAMDSA